MIIQLQKHEFQLINKLLYHPKCFPEIEAIVQLKNPGQIYVDSRTEPKSALIGSVDGHFLIGDERNEEFVNELGKFVDNVISSQAVANGVEWFEICAVGEKWDRVIEDVFATKQLQKSMQCVYRYKDEGTLDFTIPNNVSIERVTESLLNDDTIDKQLLTDNIQKFWQAEEQFLKHGLGYCAIMQSKETRQVTSICYSGFVTNDIHAIGIETHRDYRQQGLAKKVCSHFINHCQQIHMEPYWDCMQINKPSIVLAQSLGFKKAHEYAVYYFQFNEGL